MLVLVLMSLVVTQLCSAASYYDGKSLGAKEVQVIAGDVTVTILAYSSPSSLQMPSTDFGPKTQPLFSPYLTVTPPHQG